jgi:hypothetical protein
LVDVPEYESVYGVGRSRGAETRLNAGECVWAALCSVAVEQPGAGPTGEDASQLPGQVVGVGDAAVHAEPALRSGDVRGVASEEDASAVVAVGDQRGRLPDPVAQVVQFDAVVTQPTAHEVHASVLGQRFAGFGVRLVRDHEQPSVFLSTAMNSDPGSGCRSQ